MEGLNIAKVIVVCGFLGSGKTTLVESILKAPSLNKQVAVIQNEFSANMGIESTLMKDADGNDIQDFYEMPNGCICCAAKDDLINTLDALLEKKRDIQYILVETNGLADSSQLVQTFWLDEGVGSKVQLHQTIAVIDALNFNKHVDSIEIEKDDDGENEHPINELLLRQLVHADKVLLNKIDLLEEKFKDNTAEQIQKIVKCVKHVNKHASVTETVHAKADLDFLISKTEESPKELVEEHSTHKLSHQIMDNIKSVYLSLGDQKLDKAKLEFLIGELLWEGEETYGVHVMRCKGIFIDSVSGKPQILQGVEDLFEFRALEEPQEGECPVISTQCRFLFVVKGDLDGDKLKADIISRCSK